MICEGNKSKHFSLKFIQSLKTPKHAIYLCLVHPNFSVFSAKTMQQKIEMGSNVSYFSSYVEQVS